MKVVAPNGFLCFPRPWVAAPNVTSRANTSPCQPSNKGATIVIPTGFSLGERHSSEFSRPYHQSVLQKAGGFEVTQESGDGLIDLLRNPWEFLCGY